MAVLYENHINGVLSADAGISDTSISASVFASLPVVASPDTMWLVLDPDASAGAPEVVQVTAHTASATSVTVVRAQQSTVARAHLTGVTVTSPVTASDLDGFLTEVPDASVSTAKLVDDAVTAAKLADAAVVTASIVDDAVTTAKINALSVGTTELAAGAVTLAKQATAIGCSVSAGSGQSLPSSTNVDITYDSEDTDTSGFYPGSGGTVTIPAGLDGLYAVSFSCRTTGINILNFRLELNGVDRLFEPVDGESAAGAMTLPLAASDTVKVQVITGSGSNSVSSAELHVYRLFRT